MTARLLSGLRARLGGGMARTAAPPAAVGRSWLFGASHIGAIRRAQQARIAQGGGPEAITGMQIAALGASRVSKLRFHRIDDDGGFGFSDAGYQRNFDTSGIGARIAPGDRVGVQMGDANGILLDHGSYWSRHAPAWMAAPGTPCVPRTTIEAICDAESAPVRAFMADLARLGYRPYWVPYPPIKQDHPMFDAGVRRNVIAALDRMFLDRMTAAMTALDIPVVARPLAAQTPEGLLHRAYSLRETAAGTVDWLHANTVYGDLMLDEIERVL